MNNGRRHNSYYESENGTTRQDRYRTQSTPTRNSRQAYNDYESNGFDEPLFPNRNAADDDFEDIEPDEQFISHGAYSRSSTYSRKSDNRPTTYRGDSKASKHRSIIALSSAFILLNLILIGFIYISRTYAFIGSPPFNVVVARTSDTELDLSDSGLSEFKGLSKLHSLRFLDLRDLDISIDKYNEIECDVPSDCDIKWSVPLGTQTFDNDSIVVSFSDAVVDLSAIKYFDKINEISALNCTQYEELKELSLSMPDCRIKWQIPFNGSFYSSDTKALTLEDGTDPDEALRLKLFPQLATVDASGYTDYDTLFSLVNDLPSCSFSWTAKLADQTLKSTDTSVVLGEDSVSDIDKFITQLNHLPLLKRIDMCECALPESSMEKLCNAFPDRKFIWVVKFGSKDIRYWTLRTDATIFSTLNPSGGTPFDQDDFAPLFKYCTDLVALDLGHNSITDISSITNLKKLKFLILADNQISDISPLSELHDLEFLEIWSNSIKDVSPLTLLNNLKDIDLANNFVSDLTPLYAMTDLRSIRLDNGLSTAKVQRNPLSYDQLNQLGRALPDCHIEHLTPDGFPFYRNTPRYLGMKMAFTNYEKVISFNGYNDIKYADSFYKTK